MVRFGVLSCGVACSLALLLAAGRAAAATDYVQVAGVGTEAQGADVAVVQLDGNAAPDLILMANDHPGDGKKNSFRYRVVRNLDAKGQSSSVSDFIEIAGGGTESQGAGVGFATLNVDDRPDLIMVSYDAPKGDNSFMYSPVWDLDEHGDPTSWSVIPTTAPGVGTQGQGAAVVVGELDGSSGPDVILVAYDNPDGPNSFRYRVGLNVDEYGRPPKGWSDDIHVDGVGSEAQGMGGTLANFDANPRPDLILMAYDNPDEGVNSFRYRIGFNLDSRGVATSWQAGYQSIDGVGSNGQGAGIAITCLDADPRGDWIVMAYDNPEGDNSFRYRVLLNYSPAPCQPAGAPLPPPPARKSVTSLSSNELASLRRGVAQMMAWNNAPRDSADYRRSWQYWANMHEYINDQECAPESVLFYPGMQGVTIQSATSDDEKKTWCKCPHLDIQFLTWHRMYVYYFERVLQAAAQDSSLRLPFWDYETDGHLPRAYRDIYYYDANAQTQINPLYVVDRASTLNDGSGSISASSASTSGAINASDYQSFNDALEGTPHGTVHGATGFSGGGYMGIVPSAALDPVFYAHHANIDRIYECWLEIDEAARLPSDQAQLDTQFTFVDGDGSLVTRKVRDMLTTDQLGYGYYQGGGCPAPAPPPVAAPAPPASQAMSLDVAGPTRLERGVTTVRLSRARDIAKSLSARLSGGARARLVIEGLEFDRLPLASLQVFLRTADGRRVEAGVIGFFGRTGRGAHHRAAADAVSLDVTEALRAAGGGDALVFEPVTGLSDSTLEQAVARIPPDANVRFRRARIVIGR